MQNKFYNLLGLAKRAGRISVGYNKCEEAINFGKSRLVILSDELAENSLKKFKKYCDLNKVPCILNVPGSELTELLGRDKIIKVVSINDEGFAKKLSELWIENKPGGDHIV